MKILTSIWLQGKKCGRRRDSSIPETASPCDTYVDVGRWWRKGRVWVDCTPSNLVLIATGVRPYLEAVPFDQLQDSVYNPVTGEMVLAPAEGVRVQRLRMDPVAAQALLQQITGKDKTYA